MKKFIYVFASILFILFIFTSCSDDEVINTTNDQCNLSLNDSGAFILSEGGFNPNTSSLYYYDIAHDSIYPNVFCPGNLGPAPDGLIINGQNIFLAEQGSYLTNGKLYKLTLNGKVVSSNTAGINPYSLTYYNNKIYVTNGPAGKVTVIDAASLSVIKTITVGVYPQEIFLVGGKVFVCNTSAIGGQSDSTISVIDAATDSVSAIITVRKDPSSLALTNDGFLLTGCPFNASIIYKIDPVTNSILDSIIITGQGGFGKDIVVDNQSNDAFFINGTANAVLKVDLVTGNLSSVVTLSSGSYIYGYNFDKINRKHYILDALNFAVSGKLYVYNVNGNLEKTKTVGLGPRRVVFKNQ